MSEQESKKFNVCRHYRMPMAALRCCLRRPILQAQFDGVSVGLVDERSAAAQITDGHLRWVGAFFELLISPRMQDWRRQIDHNEGRPSA